ncbi:SEL1-like repeat protein [Pedobacter sp. PLR]|uniref:SEL1-like repeat protein n=1 Tax=Pedobacter sp. PLR TaxID=2994465 RepID=UPI00224777C2|nr:SEL1-like repeat protein [Pedobacter sp. PLR]MCX2450116.1 SEL1-like repeat protein [Pedobacter sp. PLR]
MSHRTYLYNINTPSVAEDTDTMMMEWGYEMPLMLQPLLIEGGFISGNNYNNFVEFNDSGLYYNAKAGLENLKRFYNFLEDQPDLIENIKKFKEARDKLFNYLDQLDGDYFHLDMWDVLNMEDKPHAEQAKDWLATIAHNNQVITAAMESGDSSLLNYKELKDVSAAFTTFPKLLNYEDYDYGWTCIWQPYEQESEFEIFEENQLWGLKDKEGRVLLNPYFDEFFMFGPQDLAVVSKNGKYGYVDTTGKIAIPLTWDDAFDFEESGVAVVVLQEKTGLINTSGTQITGLIYDDLKVIEEGDFYNAKIDGLWGTINTSGKVGIAFEHENEIQAGYGFFHIEVTDKKDQKIFNEFSKYLGEFPIQTIENLEGGLLLIKPHKGFKFSSIYKKDGTLLDSGFEKISRETNFPDLLVIKKDKKHGIISRKTENYVLPCQSDAILDIGITIDGNRADMALIRQGDQKGIYNGNPEQLSWLIPADNYQEIIWLDETVFALQKNKKWSIANLANHDFSDYEFDLIARKPAEDGFAYAFREDKVYTVSATNISATDKAVALEHAGDYYVYYFEYESRKRLLAYGKGRKMNEQQLHDELSPVDTLFELAEQAFLNEDYAKAIYFYTISSEKGHTPSMNNLAHIYYIIKGFEDDDKAFFWYHKGALADNQNTMNGLGMCYKSGTGCRADIEKAIYWLNKAAEAQLALANNNLGDIYSDEELPHFNLDKALEHYLAAADQGEPKYNWLGYLYDSKEEYEKALEYYQSGANEGHEIATYNLAVLHGHGLGTEKNIELAVKYFRISLDLGYPHAHIELARIYRNEPGFKDENKVAEHIKEARAAEIEIPEDLLVKKKGWFDF